MLARKSLRHYGLDYKFDCGGNVIQFQQLLACVQSQQKIMAPRLLIRAVVL